MKGLKVGDKVMAKWPGSALWFPAVITGVGEDGDSYDLKFEDGFEDEFAEKHVTKATEFRSRSRSRSPARKSPTRKRSRSPGRPKKAAASPPRKAATSPSRKAATSSSRKAATSPSRKSRSPARSPSRKAEPIKITPTRQIRVPTKEDTTQSVTRRTVTRSESYSTRSATRSGVQALESPVEVKRGKVPKTTQYEFGGPIGAFIMMLVFPLLAFYLYFACGKKDCELAYPTIISTNWRDYYDCTAYEIVLGWVVFQAIFTLLPIGRELRGSTLRTGMRLKYRLNGLLNGLVSIGLFITMIYFKCGVTILFDKFLPMMTCAMILSLVLGVVLYILARRAPGNALSPKGNTGNIFYDFFMGHELNPRPFRNFDVKFFSFRIALISWALLDIAFLASAWTDFPNKPPYPLLCVVVSQVFYCLDILIFEDTLLTSYDIQKEGVGFFAIFTMFVSLPFTYSLQPRYLASHLPKAMPLYCLIPIILLNVIGYIMFRQSNLMKHQFRRNPNAKGMAELESIPTASGRRLLTAGWWGCLRKPNYVGDILIALSWSLFCGFDSGLPYFYPIFLTMFLIMREMEDSKACRDKYGAAWDRYCKRVPYRFIPKIY